MIASRRTTNVWARSSRRAVALLVASAGLIVGAGCETDSFINPSVTGRWEKTPTIVPILERLSMVEDRAGDFVEYSEVAPEDLQASQEPYRLGPGDSLEITLYDDVAQGSATDYTRIVDTRGFIDLPQLGQVYLQNMTVDQARAAIETELGRFVTNPLASLNVVQLRNQTYTVIGAVETPGPFFIPKGDYRLLEALTAAGRFSESLDFVYVIRQSSLSEPMPAPAAVPGSAASPTPPPPSGDSLLDTIERLSAPAGGAAPAPAPAAPEATPPATNPPADLPPPVDLPDGTTGGLSVMGMPGRASLQPADAPPPVIDLPDGSATPQSSPTMTNGGANWVFVNGRWVQAGPTGAAPAAGSSGGSDSMVTQRVVRVPVKPLLAGDARYNVVVRPGDVIRVPSPPDGVVYIDGQVQRPGVYNFPASGRLTLTRALTAAGGYGELAIPERVDIVRVLPGNRQATVRLDARAIAEGTQPDIDLKPDDRVNVGTNFWAYPLAILRNGLRATYGFGFLLDRNFGNDVFGPEPVDRSF